MTASIWSAAFFLPAVLPICLWVAWSDLSRMKIPNIAVLVLLAAFVVIGLVALPFDIYLWRLVAGLIVFGVGFMLYLIGGIGAGDIKFAAAMAPFFDHGDLSLVLYLFAGVLLAAVVTHRIARRIPPIRKATPGWVSWDHKKFPMGLALAGTLLFYMVAALFLGA
jgi:prepilin peptidase CpaA